MSRVVHTLACPKCCRGWKSADPQGTCTGCGLTVASRGQYTEISLGRDTGSTERAVNDRDQ